MINDMHELEKNLDCENADWRKFVFEKTGVVVLPGADKAGNDWRLVSNCGESEFISLEYDYESNNDIAENSCIKSIADLIEHITESRTFRTVLQDVNFGTFNKSDLFWGIQYRIMRQNCYKGNPLQQVYGMRAISKEGNTLWFDTSACGLDEIPGVEVEMKDGDTLTSVIEQVAQQLKEFRDSQVDWSDEEYPRFSYEPTFAFTVPRTFEEVSEAVKNIQY